MIHSSCHDNINLTTSGKVRSRLEQDQEGQDCSEILFLFQIVTLLHDRMTIEKLGVILLIRWKGFKYTSDLACVYRTVN